MQFIKEHGDRFLKLLSAIILVGTFYFFLYYLPETKAVPRSTNLVASIIKSATIVSPPSPVSQIRNKDLLKELTSRQLSDSELIEQAIQSANLTSNSNSNSTFRCNP